MKQGGAEGSPKPIKQGILCSPGGSLAKQKQDGLASELELRMAPVGGLKALVLKGWWPILG